MDTQIREITASPDILGGTPVFRGTRVPFEGLIDYLESGDTIDDFVIDFPSVTREQVVRALAEIGHTTEELVSANIAG